jgi:hypothetical protein
MACADTAERLSDLTPGSSITTPREHYALLHTAPHGEVITWDGSQPGKNGNGIWGKIKRSASLAELLAALDALEGQPDRYMTTQQFRGWRKSPNIHSHRCCFIDIDGIDGSADLDKYVDRLHSVGVPYPSFYVHSGNGLHLYWLLDPAPGKAWKLWDHIQRKIYEILDTNDLNGHPDARDCARILRVCGSINGKNGRRAHGQILTGERWTLRELADEVLGPRASYETRRFRPGADQSRPSTKKKKKKEKADVSEIRPRQPTGTPIAGYSRWHGVYKDLIRIAEYYNTIPRGYRQTWIYLAANALSWFCEPASLNDEIERLIKRYTPDPDGPRAADLQHIVRHAKDANATDADGNSNPVLDSNGRDPRYRMSRAYLTEKMGGLIPNAIATELRTIGSDKLAEQQKRERKRRNKQAERAGKHTRRDEYEGQAKDWQARAQALSAEGWSNTAIAAEVGRSRSRVSKFINSRDVQVCRRWAAPPAGGARSAGARKAPFGRAEPGRRRAGGLADNRPNARARNGRDSARPSTAGGRVLGNSPSSAATEGSEQTERATASATPCPLGAGEVPRRRLLRLWPRPATVGSLNLSTGSASKCDPGRARQVVNRRAPMLPPPRKGGGSTCSRDAVPVDAEASVVRQFTVIDRQAAGRGTPFDRRRQGYETPVESLAVVRAWSGRIGRITSEQRLNRPRLTGSRSLRSPSRSGVGRIGRRWFFEFTGVDFDYPVLLLNLGQPQRQYVVDGEIARSFDGRVDAVQCRLPNSGRDLGPRHGAAVSDDADLRMRLFLGAYRWHADMLILPLADSLPFQRDAIIIL